MKPTEIDALIEDCLEGRLSESDAARLSSLLEQSPGARARYWEVASIHGLLEHTLQDASLRAVTGQSWQEGTGSESPAEDHCPLSPASSLRLPNRLSYLSPAASLLSHRSIIAAAAGIVFGMFCTSVVFGFVVQRTSEKKVPVAIYEPGFEDAAMPLDADFPNGSASWAGDAAQVVAAENGISTREGRFMLRLEPQPRGMPRVFQVLDLAKLPADPGEGMREIEVSASFAAPAAETRMRYVIRAFAVSEAPENLKPDWFDRREESIASATRGLDVMAEEKGWQTFGLRLQIPSEARSLVLIFGVRTPDKAAPLVPHYLDDVQVSLIDRRQLP